MLRRREKKKERQGMKERKRKGNERES